MIKSQFKRSILFYVYFLIFWLIFFIVQKIIFLLFHAGLTKTLPLREMLLIFSHGFSMDISASFYAAIIPTLLIILSSLIPWKILRTVLDIYMIILLFTVSVLYAADLELYHYWNFRIDKTPLKYLDAPGVMLASISVWIIIRQLMIAAGIFLFSWRAYRKRVRKHLSYPGRYNLKVVLLYVFLLAFSIIPLRGGVGVAPMNSGFAYFSQHPFANHAALNMPFHLTESLVNNQPEKNPFVSFSGEKAGEYLRKLLPDNQNGHVQILKTSKPNIILIILESFTAKVIEPLGGLPGITPNINRLCHEGIFFDHFFASGDRTDKALPAILSCFPALPDQSVTKIAEKAEHLPSMPEYLKQAGYNTAFYYGGTINFAGLRAYLTSARFDRITDIDNFSMSDQTSKWGVHDQIVFDTLYQDINQSNVPFFKVVLTLSSHEPYDVPMKPVFKGKDEETLFLNSLFYTDSIVGNFIEKAKQQTWWDSTLVILLADHGVRLPGNTTNEAIEKFKIPMIWIGGAIVKDTIVSKIASQTDIFPTLAAQMNLPSPVCRFGKNIFSSSGNYFAYYAYNSGFGFVTDTAAFIMDNILEKPVYERGNVTEELINIGKAFRQCSYDYFLGL